ncbi:hypothetical protein [Bosea sp. AS-1]|uniref:hypothetical protein n=1 Tax=Bosea sp. AS-1 TaxID=2015316 RepID=UPI000B787F37|nr:hypothetical protein [Bosea sp. AS-1]
MSRTTRDYIIEYEFTSTKAQGDNYTRRLVVKTSDVRAALAAARIEGFSAFGAAFNDNCIDWRVVRS